jgi:hypothetical protein
VCWRVTPACVYVIPGVRQRMKQISMPPSDAVPKSTASHSLALAAFLLLLQKLNQRHKRRRRQSHAAFQSAEEPGKALTGNDFAGTLARLLDACANSLKAIVL